MTKLFWAGDIAQRPQTVHLAVLSLVLVLFARLRQKKHLRFASAFSTKSVLTDEINPAAQDEIAARWNPAPPGWQDGFHFTVSEANDFI